jgi:asparagine synthase (glutamine-hydrolysing)
MCGLAGFFQPSGWRGGEAAVLARAMAQRIAYRGPNDAGVWVDEPAGIALAHRRLSILDVSPAGRQPMTSASGRYVLAFNGEIYNHQAWRTELQVAVPAWRGSSDTETLLAGIEAWGLEAALCKTEGMFSFALWDRSAHSLTLARDRLGEKPLYYGWQGDTLLFGSEMKALRAHPAFRAGVDRQALAQLVRFGAIPAPASIYEGVYKLLPGCWMTFDAGECRPLPRRYWALKDVVESGAARRFTGTPEDAVKTLDRILGESVAQQMVADVPLGAFLSGGVDSSTIVSLMQARSSQPVRTFTVGFEDKTHDEAGYARAVARHLGTAHTEICLSSREAMEVIPSLPGLYCEPLADPSQIPTVLVSRLAKTQVTVSLSGDAGDELFAGYSRYRSGRALWRPWDRLSPAARAAGAGAIRFTRPDAWGALVPRVPARLRPAARALSAMGDKLHKAAGVFEAEDSTEFYRRLMSQWPEPEAVVLGAAEPALRKADGPWPWSAQGGHAANEAEVTRWAGWAAGAAGADDFVHQMMATDLLAYLPDHVLAKVDRAGMSAGLETRVPMLSPQVVAFAWRLPMDLKLRHGVSKWVLRKVLSRYVPDHLIDRPKMGFGVPLAPWLRGPMRPWAEALLEPSRLAREGYFKPALIGRKWSEHLSGQHDWSFQLWNVLMFQAWLDQRETT